MIEKRSKLRLKKEIFIIVKILYWLKIGLLLVISENFLRTIRKNNVLSSAFPTKNSLLSGELFSYRILKTS